MCFLDPYPTSSNLQLKRATARRIGTTFAYDFLGLMKVSLIKIWSDYLAELQTAGKGSSTQMPVSLFNAEELVLDEATGELSLQKRVVGTNDIGMVAWHCTLKTPEYAEGRDVVIIANDVTVQSGSFGVREDDFFKAASEYARARGLPRIYIACNSGARIGLVEELKPKFKVNRTSPRASETRARDVDFALDRPWPPSLRWRGRTTRIRRRVSIIST